MADVVLAQLRTELTTDPTSLGLAGLGDAAAAEALSLRRAGIDVDRLDVPSMEILAAIDYRDYGTATAAQRDYLARLLGQPLVRASAQVKAAMAGIFSGTANAQGTLGRLSALLSRKGSRAEALFGFGAEVTPSDVARARAS